VRAARPGGAAVDAASHFPGLDDGIEGVEFIEAVVASSRAGGTWVRLG